MKSPWFRSRTVLVVAAVAFLLLLGALALPFLIPIDSYRPLLVWAIESVTGREVQIDSLKLSFLPTVHVTVVNFSMKNPPGFPAGDALTASSIDLGVAPQALLSRRLDITYIAPSGVQVHVLRNAAGLTNFSTSAPATTPAQKPAPVFTLEPIGAVHVQDAEITFADALGKALPAPTFSLRGVSGTIGSVDTQVPDWAKKLDIVADLRGVQLVWSNLTKPIDFHSGELTIHGGAARSTFSLSVGGINLAGAAAFLRLDPLSITFAVSGPELDFASLVTFLNGTHGSATAPARRLLASGTVAIGKVVFAPLQASSLKGQLDLYTSAVRLNAFSLSAYGGTVRGNAALTGSAGIPIAVTAQARGLNVARVLAAVASGAPVVSGALDTSFQLTSLLTRDPLQSLQTSGTFAVRNGSLPSVGHFSYLGGDLRIARERGYSNSVTLLGPGIQATSRGSFGFDQSLQYSGTAVVAPLTQGSSITSSPVYAALQPMLANVLPANVAADRMRMPFTLRGTVSHPQFALAGAPQLMTSQGSSPAVQLPGNSPTIQDLEKLIPGL